MDHDLVKQTKGLLQAAAIVFWDFDGVIKDSLDVKSDAFQRLFLPYGVDLAGQVRRHHETHCGISRYEKIPLYLEWAGELADVQKVEDYCKRFSGLVLQAVIDSPWVPGVREFLQENHGRQGFVLLSATPQEEIQYIVNELGISSFFREIHGAPTAKATVIRDVLQRMHCVPDQAVMVGDAEADFQAAEANDIGFLLRRTSCNKELQNRFRGPCFDDLACPEREEGSK